MKYMVIGSGSVSSTVITYLARAERDVVYITRDEHLEAIKNHGLVLDRPGARTSEVFMVDAYSIDAYEGASPDVIITGIKGYNLDELLPFIKRVAKPETLILPLSSIWGTGARLREILGDSPLAIDASAELASRVTQPGRVRQRGDIMSIVMGIGDHRERWQDISTLAGDLAACGIDVALTKNSASRTYERFAFLSPLGALAIYYDVDAAPVQAPGEQRELFKKLMAECIAVGNAMGLKLPSNLSRNNLETLDNLAPDTTMSLYRDIHSGQASEIGGLVYMVCKLGDEYGVETPSYDLIAEKFGGYERLEY